MLMNYRIPTTAADWPGWRIIAIVETVFMGIRQIYKAVKHRRATAALADQDDRMLADIGLTRSDLRDAIGQPWWCDPTTALAQRAGAARRDATPSRVKRWRPVDRNRRALAALDDEELSHLSDIGRRVRREARRELAAGY